VSSARAAAIIVAGGTGERLGRPGGKQLAPVHGKPVLSWALAAFDAVPAIDLVVIVCDSNRTDEFSEQAVKPIDPVTAVRFAASGDTRQESVASGLAAIPDDIGVVLVHDGARPLVTPALVGEALKAFGASGGDGLFVGHPAVDTLKVVEDGVVVDTPDRARFWTVQTPQIFSAGALREAYSAAAVNHWVGTDDASLVERNGGRVVAFKGPRDNIKVTVAEDLLLVEAALTFRESGER
jgi:2-C-methyl-D-erythritol 4-phosphate cytidylyltransferase